jgi:hypothetical protein
VGRDAFPGVDICRTQHLNKAHCVFVLEAYLSTVHDPDLTTSVLEMGLVMSSPRARLRHHALAAG